MASPDGLGEGSPDEQLLLRFRDRRDLAAFERLYDRYESRLVTFAARMVGRSSVADDVLQETWMRALKHLRDWSPEVPVRPWLFRITRNLCLDHLKSKGVQLDVPMDSAKETAVETGPYVLPSGDPLFLEIAEQAVMSLTPAQREVVLLRVDGMTFAEISEATSVGTNTLKSRMNQARQLLESYLKARGFDGHR